MVSSYRRGLRSGKKKEGEIYSLWKIVD